MLNEDLIMLNEDLILSLSKDGCRPKAGMTAKSSPTARTAINPSAAPD
jgi:hypothetical protein